MSAVMGYKAMASSPYPRTRLNARAWSTVDVVIEASAFHVHPMQTIARGEGIVVGSPDRRVVEFVLDPRIAAGLDPDTGRPTE